MIFCIHYLVAGYMFRWKIWHKAYSNRFKNITNVRTSMPASTECRSCVHCGWLHIKWSRLPQRTLQQSSYYIHSSRAWVLLNNIIQLLISWRLFTVKVFRLSHSIYKLETFLNSFFVYSVTWNEFGNALTSKVKRCKHKYVEIGGGMLKLNY